MLSTCDERVKLLQQQYVTLCGILEFDIAFNLIVNNGEWYEQDGGMDQTLCKVNWTMGTMIQHYLTHSIEYWHWQNCVDWCEFNAISARK